MRTCENCIHHDVCRYPLEYRANPETCWKYEEPRPHGEWIEVTAKDGQYYCYHKCSICGQKIESGFDKPPEVNFCPNCGADMRQEKAMKQVLDEFLREG